MNLSFIGDLGNTADITHTVTQQLGGTPGAETMLDLGLIVAEGVAGDPSADIVMSVAPSTQVGDLGEVTFDVTGLEDLTPFVEAGSTCSASRSMKPSSSPP